MRLAFPAICFAFVLVGCAGGFEISTDSTGLAQKKATKPTGSNFARAKRDPDLEGWRQGMGPEEMREFQRARPMVMEGGGTSVEGKGAWKR